MRLRSRKLSAMTIIEHFPVTDLGEGPQSPDVMPLDWLLRLSDGRDLFLTRVEQHRTYGAMLCGFPHSPEDKVSTALAEAKKWDEGFHGEPVIIPATILRGIKSAPTDPRFASFGRRAWAMLPQVTTFAEFRSDKTANDDGEVFSSALLVWWQAQFGIPSDEDLLARIRTVDWCLFAKDWSP